MRCSAYLALAALLLLGRSTSSAQWQLPPGTSSSVDDAPRSSTDGTSAAIIAAEKQMQAEQWAAAVKLLQPVCAASPKNAHAFFDLGFSQEALHDDAAAKDAYQQAVAAESKAVEPRVALGLMLAREGESAQGAKLLREAVALPATPETKEAQARAYRALARLDLQGAPDRSRDELLAALKLGNETPDDVLLAGEVAEALHDPAGAQQAYARALAMAPDSPEVTSRYVNLLSSQQKYEQATALLHAAAALHPNDSSIMAEEAGLLVRQKQFEQALPPLQKLHTTDPANVAVTQLLARSLVAMGRPAEADTLFAQLHRSDPADGEIAAEWADSLIRQKRNAEAETLLEPALQSRFTTPEARSQAAQELAFAAAADHHPDTVIRAITIRNEKLPMDAPSAFLLATAHDTLHHTRQSAGYYRQFLELADKKFPDEEWQAQQRLQVLSHAK